MSTRATKILQYLTNILENGKKIIKNKNKNLMNVWVDREAIPFI